MVFVIFEHMLSESTFLQCDSVYKTTLLLIHLSKQCQLVISVYVEFFHNPLKTALQPKYGLWHTGWKNTQINKCKIWKSLYSSYFHGINKGNKHNLWHMSKEGGKRLKKKKDSDKWRVNLNRKSNKMPQHIKILFHIYMKLNMFQATHRPSSGA